MRSERAAGLERFGVVCLACLGGGALALVLVGELGVQVGPYDTYKTKWGAAPISR